MDWPKRFSAGVFTGVMIPVTEELLSTGLTRLLHGPYRPTEGKDGSLKKQNVVSVLLAW